MTCEVRRKLGIGILFAAIAVGSNTIGCSDDPTPGVSDGAAADGAVSDGNATVEGSAGGGDGAHPDGAKAGDGGGAVDGPRDGSKGDALTFSGLGQACKVDAECATGHCADGVCCNSACSGSCVRCDAASSKGLCSPVAAGQSPPTGKRCSTNPRETCGHDGKCDGVGHCRNWPAGTICRQPRCEASTPSGRLNLARLCDGEGSCRSAGRLDCAPYTCDTANARCFSSCTATGFQCETGKLCVNGLCDGKRAPGASCSSDSQCNSGHCTGGVCCDSACTGTCETCALKGAVGRCVDVPAGRKPVDTGKSCPVDTNPCGRDGTCNGDGRCGVRPKGTVCGSPTCIDGLHRSELNLFTCNGDRGSPRCEAHDVSCGSYRCVLGGGACLGTCTSDKQCAANRVCVGGRCLECRTDAQCGLGQVCVNNRCEDCRVNSDCPAGQVCRSNNCVGCRSNSDCASGQLCHEGRCVQCVRSSDCTSGQICFGNKCFDCVRDSDCAAGKRCFNNKCI